MSEYIDRAEANAKKLKVDRIMVATIHLLNDLGLLNPHFETTRQSKIWKGYRKKLRRIL